MASGGKSDPRYTDAILKRVRAGMYDPLKWTYVTSSIPGHTATFAILSDAMTIDGVRFAVDANTNQLIADQLGALLLTPKLADLTWYARAVTLPAVTLANTPADTLIMSKLRRMLLHSQKIDELLAKTNYQYGFVRDVGKFWVLTNSLSTSKAANYGFFDSQGIENCVDAATMGPCRLFQGPWTKHDPRHIDYSQINSFASRQCIVDNGIMDLAVVLKDPVLAPLASHEGVLKFVRQPGVASTAVGGISACTPSVDGTDACPIQLTGLPPEDGAAIAAALAASHTRALVGGALILTASVVTALAMRKYMARRAAQLLSPA